MPWAEDPPQTVVVDGRTLLASSERPGAFLLVGRVPGLYLLNGKSRCCRDVDFLFLRALVLLWHLGYNGGGGGIGLAIGGLPYCT